MSTFNAIGVAGSGVTVYRKWLDAVSDNIANIETPGYRARKVEFESALQGAIAHGDSPASVRPSTQTSLEPTRLNGSNVNLDEETLSHIDTTMRYQLTIRALDGKYGMLRDAIKGGS